MKLKYFILALIATAFLSSYITDSNNIDKGDIAPKIITTTDSASTKINEKNNLRLIHFWNPENPASRILNKEYSQYLSDNPEKNIEYISICMNNDDFLSYEVMKKDGILSSGTHLLYSEVDARVFKDYEAQENPRSFLISPEGKIISVSPSVTDLSF